MRTTWSAPWSGSAPPRSTPSFTSATAGATPEALRRLYPRIPLEQVPGNCDLGRFEERERVVFFGDCRALLCHGHTLGVKSSLLRASYEARERGAQALLYGHTHIPHIDYHDWAAGSSIPAVSATIAARPTGC